MKRNRDIVVCLLVVSALFILTIILSLIVVESPIVSNASNDAWLLFTGSLSGSFIVAIAIFLVLYLIRKDMMKIKNDQCGANENEKLKETGKVKESVKDKYNCKLLDKANDCLATIREKYEQILSTPCWAYIALILLMSVLAVCYKKGFHYHFSENLMYGVAGSFVVSLLIDLGNTSRERKNLILYKERILSACGGSCLRFIRTIAWLANKHYSCEKNSKFDDWVYAVVPNSADFGGGIEGLKKDDMELLLHQLSDLQEKTEAAINEFMSSPLLSMGIDDSAPLFMLQFTIANLIVDYEGNKALCQVKDAKLYDLQNKIIEELKPTIKDVFPEIAPLLENVQGDAFWNSYDIKTIELEQSLNSIKKKRTKNSDSLD